MKKSSPKQRQALTTSIILLIFLAITLITIHFLQRNRLHRNLAGIQKGLNASFQYEIDETALHLNTLLDFIVEDEDLQEAWDDRDRPELDELGLDIFTQLKKRIPVTHLSFLETDGTYFFRVHNPDKYGDVLDRQSFKKAEKTQETAHGIELEETGNFVLRIVRPWVIEGELEGYIELGTSVKPIVDELSQDLNLELFFVVDQDYLHQDREEGRVIIDQTFNRIPARLRPLINKNTQSSKPPFILFSQGDLSHAVTAIPLKDGDGMRVGNIWFLKDVSADEKNLRTQKMIIVGAFLLFTVVFFLFRFPRYSE
tara:strand:+ start:9646 stop:10581 length:936 start_codon:yes stop_codon:yes gene_type:complete